MKRFLLSLATLLLLPALALAEPKTIRILHVNDFHGFANPVSNPGMTTQMGGAAWLAERIDRLRAEKPAILLAAGDMIQGDTWATFTSGGSVIELMNLMRFDAMTTGNHEYDYGPEVLKQRISQASFPVLAANVSGLAGIQPSTIINREGVKIAVIGLVTEDTPQTSHPRNTEGMHFARPVDISPALLRTLRGKVDLVVFLTHIGYAGDRELARELGGVLSAAPHHSMVMGNVIIIGGHSHTRIERPEQIGAVYVAQAWEHGKTLGVLDVTVDAGKIVSVSGRLEEIIPRQGNEQPAVAALVKKYNGIVDATLGRVVGRAAADLDQAGIRDHETGLGDLIADIVRQTSGAETAIINGGSIRTGIRQGEITLRDIHGALPFNNYIVAVKMTGRQLRNTLEHGVSGVERSEGRFPQVSGITFSFDRRKPVGQRVRDVIAGGQPLDDMRDYVVATLDFMAAGGDGYTDFGKAVRESGDYSNTGGTLKSSRLVFNDPGRWLRDVVADFLTAQGSISAPAGLRIKEIH